MPEVETVTARRSVATLFLTTILVIVLPVIAMAAPAFPFPPTQPGSQTPPPAADPRLAQIRRGLEAKNLRVLEVELKRTNDGDPQWWTETAANYGQPGRDKVLEQAFTMWGAMYEVLTQDNPRSLLSVSQLWTKYSIIFHSRLSALTTFVKAFQAARSDEERNQAFNAFIREARIAIWDNERGQMVDQKDFVNKNFTR